MASKKRPGTPVRSGNPARSGEAEDAREARRAKAAVLRRRELAKERSRRVVLISAGVVAALAVIAAVVVLIVRQRTQSSARTAAATTTDGPTPPSADGDTGGYVLAGTPAEGAPTLDIWLDYQCPVCKRFETLSGETYVQLATEGQARVVVHALSFLDAKLGNTSSRLAAEGAAAADVQGRFADYTRVVFANQPEEGDGYTLDELNSYAAEAGVEDVAAWQQAVEAGTYAGYVNRVQAGMAGAEVEGTPTVRVTTAGGETTDLEPGQLLGDDSATYLQAQVAAATA